MGSGMMTDGDSGMIPRVMQEIFTRLDDSDDSEKPTLRVSFMELYKEELKAMHA